MLSESDQTARGDSSVTPFFAPDDWDQPKLLWESLLLEQEDAASPDDWADFAACCFDAGDLVKAESGANRALAKDPAHAKSLQTLARVFGRRRDWPRTLEYWQQVVKVAPNRVQSLFAKERLAVVLSQLGEFDEAEAIIEELKSADPNNSRLYELQASIAEKRRDTKAEAEHWQQFGAKFPKKAKASEDYLRYMAAHEDDKDVAQLVKKLETAKGRSLRLVLETLKGCITPGEYVHALRDVLGKGQDNRTLEKSYVSHLTRHLSSAEELHEVIARSASLAARWPDDPGAWDLQVGAQVAARDYEAVQKLVDQIEPQVGQSQKLLNLRAWLAKAQGEMDLAAKLAKQAHGMAYAPAQDFRGVNLHLLNDAPNSGFRDNILLFACFRNEMEFAPWFLEYYRSIGVEWFFIIDNASNDGTAEYLQTQKDVTAYSCTDSFNQSMHGMKWVNSLISQYGEDNWCIFVDADEQLVVPDMETKGLRAFLDGMSERGEKVLPAFMLDTYPLDMATVSAFQAGDNPLNASRFFDPEHFFSGTLDTNVFRARGGVRYRLYDTREMLEKTPIMRGGSGLLMKNNHTTWFSQSSSHSAALLHFKLLREVIDQSKSTDGVRERIEDRNVHCLIRHKRYQSVNGGDFEATITKGPNAQEFKDSQQLEKLGLIGRVENLKQWASRPSEAELQRAVQADVVTTSDVAKPDNGTMIAKDNKSADWHIGLSELLNQQGRTEEALACLNAARSMYPLSTKVLQKLISFATDRNDWAELRDLSETGQKINQKAGMKGFGFQLHLTRALYFLGDRDAARALLLQTDAELKNRPNPAPEFRKLFIDVVCDARDVDAIIESCGDGYLSEGQTFKDSKLVATLLRCNRLEHARQVFKACFENPTMMPQYHELVRQTSLIFDGDEKLQWYRRILEQATAMVDKYAGQERIQLQKMRLNMLYGLNDAKGFRQVAEAVHAEFPEYGHQHLEMAERLANPQDPKFHKNKIFGIGLSKTGTTSLTRALEMMGFSTAHYINEYSEELLADRDLALYDVLTDTPISFQFEELYRRYPDAKFIYTTRPLDKWVVSLEKHLHRVFNINAYSEFDEVVNGPRLKGLRSLVHSLGVRLDSTLGRAVLPDHDTRDGDLFRRVHNNLYTGFATPEMAYHAHDKRVREFFAKHPEANFLEINFFEGDGFPELSAFLGVPAPDEALPWENSAVVKAPIANVGT